MCLCLCPGGSEGTCPGQEAWKAQVGVSGPGGITYSLTSFVEIPRIDLQQGSDY